MSEKIKNPGPPVKHTGEWDGQIWDFSLPETQQDSIVMPTDTVEPASPIEDLPQQN